MGAPKAIFAKKIALSGRNYSFIIPKNYIDSNTIKPAKYYRIVVYDLEDEEENALSVAWTRVYPLVSEPIPSFS